MAAQFSVWVEMVWIMQNTLPGTSQPGGHFFWTPLVSKTLIWLLKLPLKGVDGPQIPRYTY